MKKSTYQDLRDAVKSLPKVTSDIRYIYQKANNNGNKEIKAKELNIQLKQFENEH